MFPKYYSNFKPRLHVGDKVRIQLDKTIFQKGYDIRWSKEIYVISSIHVRLGVDWYKLKDLKDIRLPGIKYYWQLNSVAENVNPFARSK